MRTFSEGGLIAALAMSLWLSILFLSACSSEETQRYTWLPEPGLFRGEFVDCETTVFARDIRNATRPEARAKTGLAYYECWRVEEAGDVAKNAQGWINQVAIATGGEIQVFPDLCWGNSATGEMLLDGRSMAFICQASVRFASESAPALVTMYSSVVIEDVQNRLTVVGSADELARYPQEWLIVVGFGAASSD